MRMPSRVHVSRRALSTLVATVLAAGFVAVTGAPAAAKLYRTDARSSWAYIDATAPTRVFVDRDVPAPVGAWRDDRGRRHISRSYFTFDLSRYQGTEVFQAEVFTGEESVEDCATLREVELWATDPVTRRTSWLRPPAERLKLYTSVGQPDWPCPAPRVEWDAMAGVRAALARGQSTLTLELRVPSGKEHDRSYGRRLGNNLRLTIAYNTPPEVPTNLRQRDAACTTGQPYRYVPRGDVSLSADIHDADVNETGGQDLLTSTFAVWPVDEPAARVERPGGGTRSGTHGVTFPSETFAHERTYAWAARVADQDNTSPWSETCYFIVDTVGPTTTPRISSTDYPEGPGPGTGGIGVPGTFVFDAQGDPEAISYRWRLAGDWQEVRPERPGGPVSVEITPTRSGYQSLEVYGVDRAGNRSPAAQYSFTVLNTAPIVFVNEAPVGQTTYLRFQARTSGVLEFAYRLNDGPEQTVPAAAEGWTTAEVTLRRGGTYALTVRGRTGSGYTESTTEHFQVDDAPTVSSETYPESQTSGRPGVPGTFAFTSPLSDAESYEYRFDDGVEGRVPAGEDGRGEVSWTPQQAGWAQVIVRSRSTDGYDSQWRVYWFGVIDPVPQVWSFDYSQWYPSGGIGVPGEFTFAPGDADIVSYTYRLNDGPEQTVPAEGGQATVTITPDRGGANTLIVRSRNASGGDSPPLEFVFLVDTAPEVTSTDYPPSPPSGRPGVAGAITFSPRMPGVRQYVYSVNGGEDIVVAADEAGRATVSWTPTSGGWHTFSVRSRDADGNESDIRYYSTEVRDPVPAISSDRYEEYGFGKGIGLEGRFRFTSALGAEVVEYTYEMAGAPAVTVPADDSGAAEIVFTPTRGGDHVLTVRSRSTDGYVSPERRYQFRVATNPDVSSEDYPGCCYSGGAGVPGEFVFTSGLPGSVEFVYTLDGGPEVTVPVGADGTATVTITPERSDWWYRLDVRSRTATGEGSDSIWYSFGVAG